MMTPQQYKNFKNGAHRHIGYKASMSPIQMVQQGKDMGMPLKKIAEELGWASAIEKDRNPIKSARFRAGAKLAESQEKKSLYV